MMSIFRLPSGLIDDIHALFAKFWWGSSNEQRKIHWHNWSYMCLPKSQGGMGFRELKCFNAALLAKQSWRLLMGTNPLLLEVLKARYFKNSSILEANRGYDPSFTWRSIWGAKSLLKEGLGWRIGNGLNIRIWHDKWVPRGCQMVTPTSRVDDCPNDVVSSLINFENASWDVSSLSHLFDADTIDNILKIPLSSRWPNDRLFWAPNKIGLYSVKSGYWLGLLGHRNSDVPNADADSDKQWRVVWNFSGPPKLRHFLWRMCKGSLATKAVLYNRYCVPSPLCDRCGDANETIIHALVDCSKSKDMWNHHAELLTVTQAPRDSAASFLIWVSEHSSSDAFISICSTLWAAWFFRNKQIFQGESGNSVSIAADFHNLVEDYNTYYDKTTVQPPSLILRQMSWSPPSCGWVKINFDAFIAAGAVRGLGVVFRNDRGILLLAGVRRVHTTWDVEVSEAAAALFGLELAVRFGYSHIHLEGDALNVVTAIDSSAEGLSPIHLIYEHIAVFSSSLIGFGCSYVNRKGNTLAHLVASWDTGLANEKLCMDPFPQGLLTLAELDLC